MARADLQRLLPQVPDAFPGRLTADAIAQTQMRAVVVPLREATVAGIGRMLWIVLGAVSFVLLIACANVANLFLVRAEVRQQELALRRALGASRRVIVGEFLWEALALAAVGGAFGLAFASAGVGALRSLDAAIDIPRLHEIELDSIVLVAAAAVTVLSALMVSAIPAVRLLARDPLVGLIGSGRTATVGRSRGRARSVLVVAQVALALVLVAGAALMARSFAELRSVQPGFNATSTFTFRLTLPEARYPSSDQAVGAITRIVDRLAALPDVRAAGVVTKLPLDDEARRDTALFVEDRPLAAGSFPNIHQVAYASPDYFRALGIPMLAGRTLEAARRERVRREVVVSRALAARYWSGGAAAVGKRVRLNPGGAWYTIVGVVGDVRGTALEQPPDEMIYLPLVTTPRDTERDQLALGTWTPRELAFVVRGAGAVPTSARVDGVVRSVDPTIPIYRARSMTDIVDRASARTAFTLLLLAVASAAALALGAVGIYGVISYAVSQRRREIGVRIALGARPKDVSRMVSRQAIAVAALGIALGVVGALAMTQALAALLYGVSPTDPATLVGAAALLLLVAVVASWLPARRAARVDPVQALRVE
jgi:predicted permease